MTMKYKTNKNECERVLDFCYFCGHNTVQNVRKVVRWTEYNGKEVHVISVVHVCSKCGTVNKQSSEPLEK